MTTEPRLTAPDPRRTAVLPGAGVFKQEKIGEARGVPMSARQSPDRPDSHCCIAAPETVCECESQLMNAVVQTAQSQYARDLALIADDEPAFFLAMGDMIRERLGL